MTQREQRRWLQRMQEINQTYGTNFQNLEEVAEFQRAFGLVGDGKIGPKTESKIQSIITNESASSDYDYNDPNLFVPTSYFGLSDDSILALNNINTQVANGLNGNVNPENYESTIFWADQNGNLVPQSKLRKWRDSQIQLLQQQTNPEEESWVDYMGGRVSDFINGIKRDYARWKETAGKYDRSNPFRQGSDDVANTIFAIALTACAGAGLSGLYSTLVKGGVAALPEVLATLGASYAGEELWEAAVLEITGETWDDLQKRAGIYGYNRALNQPGAYAGGYAGNTAYRTAVKNAPSLFQNAIAWLEGNTPRVRVANQPTGVKKAPSGGDPAAMKTELTEPELFGLNEEYIQPGELIVEKAPTSSGNYGKSNNTGYQRTYTTPKGARGSASGQPSRVQGGQSYGQAGRGVQGRTMRDVQGGRAQTPQDYIEYSPYPEFASMTFEPGILGVPIVPPTPTEEPPEQPPIIIGPPPEEPQTGYEKVETVDDEWRDMYLKTKLEQGEGATFYWKGSPGHPEMLYKIKGGGKGGRVYGRHVANHDGYRAIDSTSYSIGNKKRWQPGVRPLNYDVPPEATLGEQIIFKSGGKLVKKPKYLQ